MTERAESKSPDWGEEKYRTGSLFGILLVLMSFSAMGDEIRFGPENLIDTIGELIITERPADMNMDGAIDIVACLDQTKRVVIYENSAVSPGQFNIRTLNTLGLDPMEAYPGDFDGDGDGDVLVTFPYEDRVMWFRDTGTIPASYTSYVILDDSNGPWATYAADLNRDGLTEPLTGSLNDGEIFWYSKIETAPFLAPHLITDDAYGSIQLAAADLDLDGDLDVLSANYWGKSYTWHENLNGDASIFADHAIQTNVNQAIKIQTSDIDLDGDQDVITASFAANSFAWHENDGSRPPHFTRHSIPLPSGRNTVYYSIADFDLDGDPDIVCAIPFLVILENIGGIPPQFATHSFLGSPSDIGYIQVADMNGDGLQDVIVADDTNDAYRLVWYQNLSASLPPPLPVRIISPNGGEILPGDSLIDIHWRTEVQTAGTALRFELWNDQGRVLDLGYGWHPDGQSTTTLYLPPLPAAADYRIRAVSTWNQQYFDESDAPFTVTGGAVRIVSPNGGEVWSPDGVQLVHWQSNPLIAGSRVRIELWKGGAFSALLGFDYDPDGESVVAVTVPTAGPGADYRIRVISTWDAAHADESDAPITLLAGPGGGGTVKTAVRDSIWLVYE